MKPILMHSIIQTAVVVRSRAEGVARVADLFGAVPAELEGGPEAGKVHGTVFAFNNMTNLEILDPLQKDHTRHRFLDRNGPGAYMLSCSLQNEDWHAVSEQLRNVQVRAVLEGPYGLKHLYRWHLHPKDAGGLLVLASVMADREDNADWAGPFWSQDISSNTRFVDQICGYAMRTADPAAESIAFAKVGFVMQPIADGAFGWRGPTGNVLELWPESAWQGSRLDGRRDIALVIRPSNREALIRRLGHVGLEFQDGVANGRCVTGTDPVLGVRLAIDR